MELVGHGTVAGAVDAAIEPVRLSPLHPDKTIANISGIKSNMFISYIIVKLLVFINCILTASQFSTNYFLQFV
jgi:hypothetical protein